MRTNRKIYYWILPVVLIGAALLDLRLGSVWISWKEFIDVLGGNDITSANKIIITAYRLPKLLTAIAAGSALGLAGLLMQTMFRNPVVGPYVLGLSGGSGLAVALVIMGGLTGWSLLGSSYVIGTASVLGSIGVLILNLALFLKLKQPEILLIAGLMIGAFSGALLSLLSYFSSAKELQQYFFWTMGNLGTTSKAELVILYAGLSGIYLGSILKIKQLNLMLLGDDYVRATGISPDRIRLFIILASGILTGIVTSITGPLAFVGLIIPHITKLLFKTHMHQFLIPGVFLTGAIFMLITDMISQLPGYETIIPVNSITALVGAPLVVHLLIRKKN